MALFFSQKLWACKTCSRAHYVISHAQKWTFSWHDKSTRAQIQQPRGVHVAASERLAYSHRLTLLVQWNPARAQRASARGVLFCSRSGFLLAQLISAPSSLHDFWQFGGGNQGGHWPSYDWSLSHRDILVPWLTALITGSTESKYLMEFSHSVNTAQLWKQISLKYNSRKKHDSHMRRQFHMHET